MSVREWGSLRSGQYGAYKQRRDHGSVRGHVKYWAKRCASPAVLSPSTTFRIQKSDSMLFPSFNVSLHVGLYTICNSPSIRIAHLYFTRPSRELVLLKNNLACRKEIPYIEVFASARTACLYDPLRIRIMGEHWMVLDKVVCRFLVFRTQRPLTFKRFVRHRMQVML